jgi:hypothetical protein
MKMCAVRVTIHGGNSNGALKDKDLEKRLEADPRCHRCCYQIGTTKRLPGKLCSWPTY